MALQLREGVVCREDIELYAKIEAATLTEAPGTFFIPTIDPEEITADLRKNIVYFMSLNGDVVGLISIRRHGARTALYISEFAVMAAYQGRGIGSSAMGALILPRLDGLKRVWLDVRYRNAKARALYQRLGFKDTKEVYNLHGDNETWIIMDLVDRERFRAATQK